MSGLPFGMLARKTYMIVLFAVLSLVLVAYGPMSSYSQAQEVEAEATQELKSKVLNELNRRIDNYQKTIQSLSVDVHVDSADSGRSTSSADKKGSYTTGYTYDDDGFHGDISIRSELKSKVKQYVQKVVKGLRALAEKVKNSTSMTELQKLADNVDTQYAMDQTTQVQGAVTQAVDSVNGVMDSLKTGFNAMQERIAQMKACAKGLKPSPETTINCDDFDLSRQNAADNAQLQLDNLKSIVSTISSMVASVVSLLSALVAQFGSLVSTLSGNLADMAGSSGLKGGGASSLRTSYAGVLSQLNLVSSMSAGANGSLSDLSEGISS